MSRQSLPGFFAAGAVFLLLPGALFADGIMRLGGGWLGSIVREISAVCRDESTQWMLVVCLVVYVVLILFLEKRQQNGTTPHQTLSPNEAEREKKAGQILLAAFVVLCLVRYAWNYSAAVKSLQLPVLLAGIVFGKAVALWVAGGIKFRHLTPVLSPLEAERESTRRANWLIGWLVVLLVVAAWYQQSEAGMRFFYHGVPRWCGAWDNPNLYGLLMGVGAVLAFGMGLRGWRMEGHGWKRNLSVVVFFACAAICAYGLFKSYSRGAWLSVVIALLFFSRHASLVTRHAPLTVWLKKNWTALLVLSFSLAVAGFWQLRFTEFLPAQRIASVGNPNDFSWRNRVTAWQGAARMLLARPLAGFGWGEAEAAYAKDYCPAATKETAAIQMNDYLMLGISAGMPAMLCFAGYVALTFRKKTGTGRTCCPTLLYRAGMVVLLIGFWFDGGLFKLPVAAVFWTLLELSRVEFASAARMDNEMPSAFFPTDAARPGTGWLRVMVILAVLMATGLSAIHCITPQLAVSSGTMDVARKFLVHPKETKNFEWLAAQPIWLAQKLKTLLDHAELATYNRTLVNWQVEEKMFQDFVLSPVITGAANEKLDWRRPLWEEYYPQVRHEPSQEDAAKKVIQQLLETTPIRDDRQKKELTVATLRAVGIPSRLNDQENAEFWNGAKWVNATQASPSQ